MCHGARRVLLSHQCPHYDFLFAKPHPWHSLGKHFQVMVLHPTTLKPSLPPRGIRIKEVENDDDHALWQDLVLQIFPPNEKTPPTRVDSLHKYLGYLHHQPVGVAQLTTHTDLRGKKMAGMWSLGVLPHARRNGIATALTTRRIEDATSYRCHQAFTVLDPKATKLAESLGFKRCCCFTQQPTSFFQKISNGEKP